MCSLGLVAAYDWIQSAQARHESSFVEQEALRVLDPSEALGSSASPSRSTKRLHRAIDIILERYVESVDVRQMMDRGLKPMVGDLDPYSYYLSAKDRQKLRSLQQADLVGPGFDLALRFGSRIGQKPQSARSLEIVRVQEGSPAEAAGIRPGDHLLAIGDLAIDRLYSRVEAQLRLVGQPGESRQLKIQRGEQIFDYRLVLKKSKQKPRVDLRVTTLGQEDHSFALVRIEHFHAGLAMRFRTQLDEFRRQQKGRGSKRATILLDLRGNPGGEIEEAIRIADQFLSEGTIVRVRGRNGRILREEKAHAGGTDTESRLYVLQDRYSASASELLAVALRDHGRARVLGEPSYGKGTVQEIVPFADGSQLTLTTGRYYSPKDQMIDGRGVSPDVLWNTQLDDSSSLQTLIEALNREADVLERTGQK